MKIAIYSIAKNEEAVAERWAKSAAEADLRVVLDTGSTDRTVEILRAQGVKVESAIIQPWRFDEARNRSLALIPEDIDICISMDMDEVLSPGWREVVIKAWTPGTTLLRYPFVTEWNIDGSPKQVSWGHKAHKRDGYYWKYAIHEILRPTGSNHQEMFTDKFRIEHRPLNERPNDRYIDAVKEWVEREPREPHYLQYLARNYFDQQKYSDCLLVLEKYFSLQNEDMSEKAFSYRMQSWCYEYLNASSDLRVEALWRAVGCSPREREVWAHLAQTMLELGNLPNAFAALNNALMMRDPVQSYRIEPELWNGKLEHLVNLVAADLKKSL